MSSYASKTLKNYSKMLLSTTLITSLFYTSTLTAAQIVPFPKNETGISAYQFDLGQVALGDGRWSQNQGRTLNYLKSVDLNRLLYVFRATHKLSTNGAQANGGWDAPDFPFRSHMQGHFLTAWAQCWSVLKDTECRNRINTFVAELAKCQANNKAAGFNTGYLSGFPESEFDALEKRTLSNGNVPYYALHKTLAGLLDAYHYTGTTQSRDVLLALAGWVDTRTSKLSYDQMQTMMGTEFGGMNDVMANIYHQTGDQRWLTVAKRFDHAAVFNPLANNQDQLNGLHANTQVPKWIGAIREYKATGDTKYLNIALNAWKFTTSAHTYAIGGNSQAEHFRAPNAIAGYLTTDTCESCNTYNMLKLTRELWLSDPKTLYFDFFEQALVNHLIGAQHPSDSHGHITYFTPLKPGGRRGVGPAWGGGTYSTDYNSFWCCQGTQVEQNTKLMDSIYFYDTSSLFINLFVPSKLTWSARGITVSQDTQLPIKNSTTLTVSGTSTGAWTMKIRIPSWASTSASVSLNGVVQNIAAKPGTYAEINRSWASGDRVDVTFPIKLRTVPANDDKTVAAVAYGPAILSGNYGNEALSAMPTIQLATVKRTSESSLAFTATAGGNTVNLGPFYDAHDFNYNVYWKLSGSLPA